MDKDAVKITEISFKFEELKETGKIEISFAFPAVNIAGMWSPSCGMNRSLQADWSPGIETMMSISAPVVCFFDHQSRNVHTIALSEVKQKLTSYYGCREEDGTIVCRIVMDVHKEITGDFYQIRVWESCAVEAYWQTLKNARMFWESEKDYQASYVPEAAKESLYSFWYSYHQLVDAENIEAESRLAAEMGFKTIIVDDGWQTDDANRGYAYCGDWEPSENKFPDFPAHVKRVQKMGIRYMIWFSVPFVGIHAKCFDRFKNKLLTYDEYAKAGVLDIRYPEVRAYLHDIYIRAVKDWGVDGLKLDFIDEFYLREDSPAYCEAMDYTDVQDALCRLLTDLSTQLRKIKPDILIEFRQRYVGPEIRKYGNMLRVLDCPGSSLANRVGVIDLRLLSGNTAIHSDMLMWHPDDTVENAALQLVSCLFSTVQISVRLAELDEKKRKMLIFWLGFMKKHKKLLQETELKAEQPQNLYPIVQARSDEEQEEVMAAYAENHYLSLNDRTEQFYYVHAGGSGCLILEGDKTKALNYSIYDCMGTEITKEVIQAGELKKIHMPHVAMLKAYQS